MVSKINQINKVFVLGSHRTGTKFISKYFNSFEAITSIHQFQALRIINIISNLYLANIIKESLLEKVSIYIINKNILENINKVYIISNGFNFLAARSYKNNFDHVKIIHLIRDPRDFVSSYYNWIHSNWKSYLAHKCIPFWNINGYLIGNFNKKVWNEYDEFEKLCYYWNIKNRIINDLYSNDADNYLLIKFEDLFHNEPVKTMNVIHEFLNMDKIEVKADFFKTKINTSKTQYLSHWIYWDKKLCLKLYNICGDLMDKYGYGNEPFFQEKLV